MTAIHWQIIIIIIIIIITNDKHFKQRTDNFNHNKKKIIYNIIITSIGIVKRIKNALITAVSYT